MIVIRTMDTNLSHHQRKQESTFSTASGKFLLKNRTTSFTLELILVLTVIM